MKITKHLRLEEALENIKDVIDFQNDNLDAHTELDIVMAAAYDDDMKAEEHLEEVNNELEDRADAIAVEEVTTPEVTVDNMYTAELRLDESIEDFKLVEDGRSHAAASGGDWEEEYLEYDMARFVSGLCGGEDYPKPLSPLGRRMRRFQSGSRDKYVSTVDGEAEALVGTPQVVAEERYVTLYAQRSLSKKELVAFFDGDVSRASRVYRSELGQISPDSPDYELIDKTSTEYLDFLANNPASNSLQSAAAFDDIRAACDIYELEYTNPVPKRSKASHWDYSMKVLIPLEDSGLPMTLEEYFGGLRDAGNPYFAGLTDEEILYKILPRDFVKTYLNYKHKVEAEQDEMSAEYALEKAIRRASLDSTTELEVFRNELETELKELNVNANTYLKKFDDEFADDFADDFEDEE